MTSRERPTRYGYAQAPAEIIRIIYLQKIATVASSQSGKRIAHNSSIDVPTHDRLHPTHPKLLPRRVWRVRFAALLLL